MYYVIVLSNFETDDIDSDLHGDQII